MSQLSEEDDSENPSQSLLDSLVHRLFQDNEPSTEPPLTTIDLNVLREEQPGPSGIAQVEQPPSKKKKASSIMKTTKTRWTWDEYVKKLIRGT